MNAAQTILHNIGGTARAMLDNENERIAAAAFAKQERIDNPVEPRMAQPLRSYLKRYRNDIAEYIRAIKAGKARQAAIEG